ncbi:MAG: class I SAM-dependent methyltransferase [Methanoregula sp.]|jgi:SAM-dependent methyltransferase|nr:class I SAM-dependent methyltransferase [Methanoregula sp.]
MTDRQSPPLQKKTAAYTFSTSETARINAFFDARQLPDCLQKSIGNYIAKKTSKELSDPVMLDRLRNAIVAQKDDYWKPQRMRSLQYTKGYSVLGYLAYHFPVYFMQTEHILAMLAGDGLLKKKMTILDIGTGPGVVPLAIADFYSKLDDATADIYSVERSEEHIEAFLFLRNACVPKGGKVSIKTPKKEDIQRSIPTKISEQADLIIFSNVLNEIGKGSVDARADLVMRYAERLAPDGSILIIEPAEENTSTQLRVLSLALKKEGLTIHSPCSFIWGTNCTPDRCWSFTTRRCIQPTRMMEILAKCDQPFRYINIDIKYSYVVLRKDGKVRDTYRVPAGSRVLRISQIHHHVDKRINLIAAKMSENLGDAKNLMFRLCDGTADKLVFAVVPSFHVTPENEAIVSAPYGTILELESVHVRYNKEHDAYNVLVSRNTRVGIAGETEREE